MEVGFGERRGSIFTLLNVAHKFGRSDPTLGVDVIDGKLDALSIMLGEQMNVFATNFHFRPHALSQHRLTLACAEA